MGECSAFLTALGSLVSSLIWPVVVVAVVVMLRPQIASLLRSDDISLSGPGGLSLVAKRKAANATDALVKASEAKGAALSREQASADVEDTQRHLESISDPLVLWVDDNPSWTEQERNAMEALGISFDLSVNTDGALEKLERRTYDAVISDMGRAEGDRAGYTLLEAMRAAGDATPVVFYTSSRSAEHVNEAIGRGAIGSTNVASELMQLVVSALRITARSRDAGTA